MKKQLFKTALVLLTIALCCSLFAACNPTQPEETKCTVSFQLDGGHMDGNDTSVVVAKGSTLDLSRFTASKDGYRFASWNDGSKSYTATESILVEKDMTLTANWTKLSYNVSFDPNGGTMQTTAIEKEFGSQLNLAEFAPVREAYRLKGWKAGETEYQPDAVVTVSAAMTFVAQWTLDVTDASNFVFDTTGETAVLTGLSSDCTLETLVVPGEAEGKRVTKIDGGAFSYNSKIHKVYLDDMTDLVEIGDSAFSGSKNLEFVSLRGLSKLTTLGDSTFYGAYNETNLLKTVDFTGCSALESIGQMCFNWQAALESVDLTPCTSLKTIDRQMFDGCSSLKTVKFPVSLQSIAAERGMDFFRACTSLESIEVAAGNLYFESENGVFYAAGKTELIKYPSASTAATSFTVPSTVKKIWAYAFSYAENLQSIDVSQCQPELIGYGAFEGCSNATIELPFDAEGKYKHGSCSLGRGWATGAKQLNYQTFVRIELTVSGITDNSAVTEPTATIRASATYGTETPAITVKLNGTIVTAEADGSYLLTYTAGKNTVEVLAQGSDDSAMYTYTVTYNTKPTISTTVENNKTYYGDTLEFDVTAKTAAGVALGADAISLKTNWGYGLNPLMDTYVTKTVVGDKVHVAIDFAALWENFFYEGGTFTLQVTATDGAASESVSYTIEHSQTVPAPTITTTVENNRVYYGSTLEFDVTAKTAAGVALGADAISLKTNWGYGLNPLMASTVTKTVVGDKVHVAIDFDTLWSMFVYEGGTFTLQVTATDGNLSADVSYTIEHRQNPTFTAEGLTDGFEFSQDVTVTVTAKEADGTAIDAARIEFQMELWTNNWKTITATVVSSEKGVITFTLSYSSIDTNYSMGMMEPFTVEIRLKDEAGNVIATIAYKNCDLA